MELAVAFVGGASAKIYDDIVDDGIPVSDVVKESLKGVQWMSLAALSLNDFNFAAIMYIIIFFDFITHPEGYKNSYEMSLLIVFPLIFLLNYHTMQSLNMYILIYPVVCIIATVIDTYIIPEHTSYKKLIGRTIETIGSFMLLILCLYLNIPLYLLKIIMYFFAYVLTSSLFQFYKAYYLVKEENPIKEDQKPVKVGEDLNAGATKTT